MHDLTEKLSPRPPPSLFQPDPKVASHLRNIGFSAQERNPAFFAELLALEELFVRLRSHSMVEMSGDDINLKLVEQVEKTRRIRTARVADDKRTSGNNHAQTVEFGSQTVNHG